MNLKIKSFKSVPFLSLHQVTTFIQRMQLLIWKRVRLNVRWMMIILLQRLWNFFFSITIHSESYNLRVYCGLKSRSGTEIDMFYEKTDTNTSPVCQIFCCSQAFLYVKYQQIWYRWWIFYRFNLIVSIWYTISNSNEHQTEWLKTVIIFHSIYTLSSGQL